MEYRYAFGDQQFVVRVEPEGAGFVVTVGEKTYHVQAGRARAGELALELDGGQRVLAYVAAEGAVRWVALMPGGQVYQLSVPDTRRAARHGASASAAALTAQMPGLVRQVLVAPGQAVARGQVLVLLEAMKMEIRISAPAPGVVARVAVTAGQAVERGQALVELGPALPG